MRLSLGDRFKGEFGMLQFLNLSHFISGIENQTPAMPGFPDTAHTDPINQMFFVLGHSYPFGNCSQCDQKLSWSRLRNIYLALYALRLAKWKTRNKITNMNIIGTIAAITNSLSSF